MDEEQIPTMSDEDPCNATDSMVLELIGEGETELHECACIEEDELAASIRRLYLSGRIRKRKDGDRIFYSIADGKESFPEYEGASSSSDRKSISLMARKFRSCRYKVQRNFVAENGLVYTLFVEKKGAKYMLSYISNTEDLDGSVFSKMLENDPGIRIVVPDNKTKLSVAKIFDGFVQESFGEENGLLYFNQKNSFRVLTVEQFFKKTTWKNLLK